VSNTVHIFMSIINLPLVNSQVFELFNIKTEDFSIVIF
jgi:hypothetical protein